MYLKEIKMKKDSQFLAFTSLCSVVMIFILVFSVFILSNTKNKNTEITKYIIETEYVYISEETTTNTEENTSEENSAEVMATSFETLVAKEYLEKIGIFNSDGEVIYCIDTYVKSLPEADRHLLKEGIDITDEKQFYNIIQDYSN